MVYLKSLGWKKISPTEIENPYTGQVNDAEEGWMYLEFEEGFQLAPLVLSNFN